MPTLPIASRLLAAIFGGYMLATSVIIACGALASTPPAAAIMASSLASFAVYTAAIVWVFAARTTRSAWLGVLAPSVLLLTTSGLAWLARGLA